MSNKVRVAIAGLGNCANSLIQGVAYYRDADPALEVPGLMHIDLGGYHVGDVEFVAAFDVDATKVGQDVSKAMWAGMNNTIEFAEVPHLGITVQRGPTFDGLGRYYVDEVEEYPSALLVARPAEPVKSEFSAVFAGFVDDGSSLAVAGAGCDNKIVRRRAQAAQIEHSHLGAIPLKRDFCDGEGEFFTLFCVFFFCHFDSSTICLLAVG